MISYLRSLADFLEPAGFVWLMLSAMVAVLIRRRQWRTLILPGVAWVVLTLTGATGLSHVLLAGLESKWPAVELAAVPECDAIIVLGGGLEPSGQEPAGIHLRGGADRLFTGLKLARMNKGRQIVVGGGSFTTPTSAESEADAAKQWVETWQMSPIPIQSLGHCLDTHDEAVKVSALAAKHGWRRLILVTSAFHMTRAKAVFEAAGNSVVPVPCNYLSASMCGRRATWVEVPNAGNLSNFEAWMHEILGWWSYRLMGWV